MQIVVETICAGAIETLPSGKSSGIAKQPIEGPVEIGPRGISLDGQADRLHHGFPAMALHHYPGEHYAWLRETFGALPRLAGAGSMGENIAASGLTEDDVSIGDRFRLGSALLEVSQPRQPCATIEQHLQQTGIVKAIVATGRCGWFYRVLEAGICTAGDTLQPEERLHKDWTIARTFAAVYGRRPDSSAMREITALPRVSDRLQRDIDRRIG